MQTVTVLLVSFLLFSSPFASGIDVLPSEDVSAGLRQALNQSASAAVDKLGIANGFLDNPKVRIPLPAPLQKAEGLMRTLGANKPVDNLIVSMNRAAEAAAAEAKPLLLDAIEKMSVEDAGKIVTGGDDGATRYFRTATSEALAQKFLPVVKSATDQAGVLRNITNLRVKE